MIFLAKQFGESYRVINFLFLNHLFLVFFVFSFLKVILEGTPVGLALTSLAHLAATSSAGLAVLGVGFRGDLAIRTSVLSVFGTFDIFFGLIRGFLHGRGGRFGLINLVLFGANALLVRVALRHGLHGFIVR